MKKLVLAILVALALLSGISAAKVNAASQAEKLKGRILIAVYDHGEAWYVNPVNLRRYYLGRPADAFSIMRKLGLGISNADLAKVPLSTEASRNEEFVSRLSGRILIQTEKHGEAWYVSPVNLKRYFMGRPSDAFQLMRNLGLGISDYYLDQIPAETKPAANVRITSHSTHVDDYGYRYIVGEAENVGNAPTGTYGAKVTATIYDDSGKVIDSDFTYIDSSMEPGASAPFEMMMQNPDGYSYYRLSVTVSS